jgi:hypothetical protein
LDSRVRIISKTSPYSVTLEVPAHNIKTETMMSGGGYWPEGSNVSGAEPVNSAAIVLVVKKCYKNAQFYISRTKMKITKR